MFYVYSGGEIEGAWWRLGFLPSSGGVGGSGSGFVLIWSGRSTMAALGEKTVP